MTKIKTKERKINKQKNILFLFLFLVFFCLILYRFSGIHWIIDWSYVEIDSFLVLVRKLCSLNPLISRIRRKFRISRIHGRIIVVKGRVWSKMTYIYNRWIRIASTWIIIRICIVCGSMSVVPQMRISRLAIRLTKIWIDMLVKRVMAIARWKVAAKASGIVINTLHRSRRSYIFKTLVVNSLPLLGCFWIRSFKLELG